MSGLETCVLYRDFEHGQVLEQMSRLMHSSTAGVMDAQEQKSLFFASIHGLVELAGSYGFAGNLWHNYLTFLLVNHENAFSMACEIVGPVEGSINEMAKNDFEIFKELYDYDLEIFDRKFHSSMGRIISDYQNINESSKLFNKRIRDRICTLSRKLAHAQSVEVFMEDMVDFYRRGQAGASQGVPCGTQ